MNLRLLFRIFGDLGTTVDVEKLFYVADKEHNPNTHDFQNLPEHEKPKRFTDVVVETETALIVLSLKSAKPTYIREVKNFLPKVKGKYSEDWVDIDNATKQAFAGKTNDDVTIFFVTRKEKVQDQNGHFVTENGKFREQVFERSIAEDIKKCDEELKIKYSPLLKPMAKEKSKKLVGFTIYCAGFQRVLYSQVEM